MFSHRRTGRPRNAVDPRRHENFGRREPLGAPGRINAAPVTDVPVVTPIEPWRRIRAGAFFRRRCVALRAAVIITKRLGLSATTRSAGQPYSRAHKMLIFQELLPFVTAAVGEFWTLPIDAAGGPEAGNGA